MSQIQLEQVLRNLARDGTLEKDRGYRQVWRLEFGGKAYYVKFYPRAHGRFKRLFRGSPAMREFTRLQLLQKAAVPSPRAVAVLMGFRIENTVGDAVLLEAIEPSQPLDLYLNDIELRGEPIPERRRLSQQIRSLVAQLGRARLGHGDLHFGNLLLHQNKVYLLDGYAVRKGGLRLDDVMMLGHSAARYMATSEMQRAWDALGNGGIMPRRNAASPRMIAKFMSRTTGDNRYFGTLRSNSGSGGGAWRGHFFKHAKYPRRWSKASQMEISSKDWQTAWPHLLERIESDQLEVLKRTRSGDVLAGEVVLGGKPLPIVVKRPRKKYLARYISEIGRGVRARRAWYKSWNLIVRNIPTAWPILVMEKRVLGYVTDAMIVFERLPGPTLAGADLDAMDADDRDKIFRRTGRLIRLLERAGLHHGDAKANNWIVFDDEKVGAMPILIDVDGIRRWRSADAIGRLLHSMREHPQYTPADSLALCKGYAPYARMPAENKAPR